MKFRPVRELLEDAMEEMVELPTREHLLWHLILNGLAPSDGVMRICIDQGPDERIGWKESHIVTIDDFPVGYVDSLL